MLRWVRYNPADMKDSLKDRIKRMKEKGTISASTARTLVDQYVALIDSSTYLEPARA
jgi:arginine decarboxylase-like protein